MKKRISLLLCLSLFLSMSCMLSGCNQDQKQIIGIWQAEINYAAAVNAGIYSADGMEDVGDYFAYDSFPLTTTFTFLSDGTYTVTLDPQSVFKAVQGIRGHMGAGMEQYLADQIKKAGLDISADAYLAMLGLNRITLGEMLFTNYTMGKIAEELSKGSSGLYRVEKGKLYMNNDINAALTEENYDTYQLDGDTLTLLECHCQQDERFENISESLYPIVLTRVPQ